MLSFGFFCFIYDYTKILESGITNYVHILFYSEDCEASLEEKKGQILNAFHTK